MRGIFLASLLFAATAAPAFAGDVVGSVTKFQAAGSFQRGQASGTLGLGAMVENADILQTDASGKLVLKLNDESEVTLGSNAKLIVDEFVYNPQAGKRGGVIKSVEGAFLWATKKKGQKEFKIETPVATIGIRGTTVWGGMIDGKFSVFLADGEVTVTNAAGSVTLNQKGQGTTIGAAGDAPTPPKMWPADKVQRAYATVTLD